MELIVMMQQPAKQFQILKERRIRAETTGVVSFLIPVEILRKRLNLVFSSPLELSDHYFSSLVDCDGRLTGNTLRIEYVKYGKGTMRYDLTGQIFGEASGSALKLTIRGRNLLRGYIFAALIGFVLPVLIGRGLAPFPIIMLSAALLAGFLVLIYFFADLIRRRSVLENVCGVLQRKIETTNGDPS